MVSLADYQPDQLLITETSELIHVLLKTYDTSKTICTAETSETGEHNFSHSSALILWSFEFYEGGKEQVSLKRLPFYWEIQYYVHFLVFSFIKLQTTFSKGF